MATPILTYGTLPFLTEVGQGISEFLDQYQSTEDMRNLGPAVSRVGSRADGLPFPNYPLPPKIRPNQLYWPTGASRWAIGYFFATDAIKKQMVEVVHSKGLQHAELKVVTNSEFTAEMYLLPPRRISGMEDSQACWLMPLVDERYYWQYENIGDFAVDAESEDGSWDDVFGQLGTQLGVSIAHDGTSSAYLAPDPEELTRRYDNAAVLLDAVSHSVGHRLVRWPDGTVKSMNFTNSETQLTENTGSSPAWQQIAGGDFDIGPVPAQVNVVFRRFVDHVVIPRKNYAIAKAPSSATATIGSSQKTIHSTLYADFTIVGTGSPDNISDLDNLAGEIATDYYKSAEHAYDRTFAGIKPWKPCGYDDHILYQFGSEYPVPKLSANTVVQGNTATTQIGKHYEKWAHTRVQSNPVNFGVECQLSQDHDFRPLAPSQFGDLDGSMAASSTATLSVWENDSPESRSETGHTKSDNDLKVFNFPGAVVPASRKCHALFDFESEKWYPVSASSVGDGTGDGTGNPVLSGTCKDIGTGTGNSCWTQIAHTTQPYDTVTVQKDGIGSDVTVRLPHVGHGSTRKGLDPNLAPGNVIAYVKDENDVNVIVSDYTDDPIGTIKMWDTSGDPPFGWAEHNSMVGRYPVGKDATQTSGPDLQAFGSVDGEWIIKEPASSYEHNPGTGIGLDHDTLNHNTTGHPTTDLDHDSLTHSDSPLTHTISNHTTTGGSDFTNTNANLAYANHTITNHTIGAHSANTHIIENHLTKTHTIADHTPASQLNYGDMYVVMFIIRTHE